MRDLLCSRHAELFIELLQRRLLVECIVLIWSVNWALKLMWLGHVTRRRVENSRLMLLVWGCRHWELLLLLERRLRKSDVAT